MPVLKGPRRFQLASFPGAMWIHPEIGAGETIVVVRAGSWAGYDLLWLVLLICFKMGYRSLWLNRFGRTH